MTVPDREQVTVFKFSWHLEKRSDGKVGRFRGFLDRSPHFPRLSRWAWWHLFWKGQWCTPGQKLNLNESFFHPKNWGQCRTIKNYLLVNSLDFNPGMLLANYRKLDSDVTTLSSSKKALLSKSLFTLNYFGTFLSIYLIDHRKCGAICAVPLYDNDKTPQHGGLPHVSLWKDTLINKVSQKNSSSITSMNDNGMNLNWNSNAKLLSCETIGGPR